MTDPQATPKRNLIDRYLTGTESNAAGRLGVYRILYALFFLWHLSGYRTAALVEMPNRLRTPKLFDFFAYRNLPAAYYDTLFAALIAAIILLMVGWRTRIVTGVVLVLGVVFESYYASMIAERDVVFLIFYIPLVFFLIGDWGATHSVDAWLSRRRGLPVVPASDTSLRFTLPIRVLLVLLVVLFTTSGVYKALPGSPWLVEDGGFAHVMIKKRAVSSMLGQPLNPLANLFLDHPVLDLSMRWFVVLFEGLFLLALVNGRLRALFLSLALVFHAVNAIWVNVTFTAILVVYGLFIDWQAILTAVAGKLAGARDAAVGLLKPVPAAALLLAPPLIALALGGLWSQTRILQEGVSLGGRVTWHTIWYPVLPLASLWFGYELLSAARQAVQRVRARG